MCSVNCDTPNDTFASFFSVPSFQKYKQREQTQPAQVQRRVIESTRLLEQAHRRQAALEQERFYLGITKEELDKPTPAIYNSIGKVFILVTPEEAKADLQKRIHDLDEESAAVAVCD